MAFEPYTRVDFGPAKAGLQAIGYTLVKAGKPIGPRIAYGIDDLGGGHYGTTVAYPSHFHGQLIWDTGGPSPQTVAFNVTPEQGAVLVSEAGAAKKATSVARRIIPRVHPAVRPALRSGFVERQPAAVRGQSALVRKQQLAVPCEPPPATAIVATIETLPVFQRLQTVIVRSGQCPSVAWVMRDANGCPVDLCACDPGPQCMVMGTLRIAPDCYNYVQDFAASSPDPASGMMIANVDPAAMGGPGIYVAEMGVFDAEGTCIAYSNQFYLVVEAGLFGNLQMHGPPSLAEIRLELRDSSPLENELLDDSVLFDNSEIAMALRNVVDYWNESLPPIQPYTTQTFPYRYWWKQGAKAQLFRIAAEWHRKNQVAYSAGGVSFDEHGTKAQQYEEAASAIWTEYKQWAQQKKISLNLDAGWSELPSDYSRFAWTPRHYY